MTGPIVRILTDLLDDVEHPSYGYELAERTGVQRQTIYSCLHRLRLAGWLSAHWEDVDPLVTKRPARRYYRLTRRGVTAARAALESHAFHACKIRCTNKETLPKAPTTERLRFVGL
jgi:DNA-binding PadR family transcriptional regulator